MSLEVLIQKRSGGVWDISELVTSVDFADNINKSGIVNFAYLRQKELALDHGDAVRICYDDVPYFIGWVFGIKSKKTPDIAITAYDQMRYLKTADTYVFDNPTATDIVNRIGSDYQMRMGEIQNTGVPLGRLIFDAKDLLDMVTDGINLTLRATKQLYYLKDDCGKLVFKNIATTVTNLCIDPESLLIEWDYERTIDSNTFNQIKLVRDNEDTGAREIYIAKDSGNIQKWGMLQYYEKVDDSLNPAQVQDKANALLLLKNRIEKKLSLDVIGDKRIRAGDVIYVSIPEEGIKQFLLCKSAKHSFSNGGHTVKADFKIV